MSYEAIGTIHQIMDTVHVNDRFQKREFVLKMEDGQYPQLIKFQIVQDRCSMLDSSKAGDEVKVHFDLRGREYVKNGDTLYFTNLNAWKIEQQSQSVASSQPQPEEFPEDMNQENPDDLPF